MHSTDHTPSVGDFADRIIALEAGDLDAPAMLDLYADLVRTGLVWHLQGSYGRTAAALIEQGLLEPDGTVTEQGREYVNGEEIR